MLCGLSVTCLPWFVKNAYLTGNPVYPLGYAVFGGTGLDAARALQWAQAHRVPVESSSGSSYSLVALANSARQVIVASEFTQPCLMFFAVVGLLGSSVFSGDMGGRVAKRLRWPIAWFTFSAWILLVWWFATHRIDRFWLPAVSIWAVLAGFGMGWMATKVSHGMATAIVLFGLLYGIVINGSQTIGDNRYFVSLEALRADGGDEETVGRISGPIAWCNKNLTREKTRLLLVGEARVYDFLMPIVYSTCFDRSPVEACLRDKAVDDQRNQLEAVGATHLLVNWTEIGRYRNPGNYGFSDWPSREDFQKMVQSGLLRPVDWPFASESAELFEVIAEKTDFGSGEKPAGP